jgi:hypothetical protein
MRVTGSQWAKRIGGRDLIAVCFLLALPIICFSSAVFLQRVFSVLDLKHYFLPYRQMASEMIKSGVPPLWNPYAFGGIPLIGDGQTALFYPPNWLFLVLPPHWALNYDILLQFWIAAIGFYALCRSFGLSRCAAVLGAASYSMSGFMVARVVHLSIMSGAALLPALFLCVDRALTRSSRGWSVAGSFVIALQVFTGHPQPVVYSAVALGLYGVVLASGEQPVWRRLTWRLAHITGIYLLGFALAAIQLLPWIELGSQSPRAAFASPGFLFSSASRAGDFLLLLFPYMLGALPEKGPFSPASDMIRLWEHSVYIGILPLCLAVLAFLEVFSDNRQTGRSAHRLSLFARRRQLLVYFVSLAVVGVMLAAASPAPVRYLLHWLPVINKLRNVERVSMLLVFALAVLAALAFEGLSHRRLIGQTLQQRSAQLKVSVGFLVAAIAAALSLLSPDVYRSIGLSTADMVSFQLSRANWWLPVLLIVCACFFFMAWIAGHRGPRIRLLAVLFVCVDVALFARSFQPLDSPALYAEKPPSLAVLSADQDVYRKATLMWGDSADSQISKHSLGVSWSVLYGVEDINGFNSLQPRRHMDLLFSPEFEDISYGLLPWKRPGDFKQNVLNLMNVKYLLAPRGTEGVVPSSLPKRYEDEHVTVFENPDRYPRVFFVDKVIAEPDPKKILSKVAAQDFDPRRVAWVETSSEEPSVPPVENQAGDVASIVERGPDRMKIRTSSSSTRFLFLSEMYFPGWQALIDGAETRIHRTDYLFKGLVVPAGAHEVSFRYRPRSVAFGLAISMLSAVVAVASLLLRGRLGRRVTRKIKASHDVELAPVG